MILTQSYVATLVVMILAMLCLGSWACTVKMGKGWRFELYYFDFAFGVLIASLLIAFTLGSSGYDGFSFMDDLMHAGKRQWFDGFVAGIIFNLANMLLMAAVSVAGLAVAFPIGIGTALIVASLVGLVSRGGANPIFVAAGCLMIVAAIFADGSIHRALKVQQHEALAKAGKAKSTRRPAAMKGLVLAWVSGLIMGSFPPLLDWGMQGELGLGPYSIAAMFGLGIFVSTFAFNIFFVNLPVAGEPAEMGDFFRTNPKVHLLGLSGGAIWAVGAFAVIVAKAAPAGANLSPELHYGLSQAFALIAALWGIVVFKEFRGAELKVKFTAALMLVLYTCGLALIAAAPLFVHKG